MVEVKEWKLPLVDDDKELLLFPLDDENNCGWVVVRLELKEVPLPPNANDVLVLSMDTKVVLLVELIWVDEGMENGLVFDVDGGPEKMEPLPPPDGNSDDDNDDVIGSVFVGLTRLYYVTKP